jgi:hypothetical protein
MSNTRDAMYFCAKAARCRDLARSARHPAMRCQLLIFAGDFEAEAARVRQSRR